MYVIPESEYRLKMEQTVEPELKALHQQERMTVKGGELAIHCYLPENMRAQMLLLHGTSESAEKYHEMIWYFLQCGIGVIAPDMRGHGKSLRLTDDPCLIHTDRFEDYVDDALKIVNTRMNTFTGPLFLYGHSLGGAVAAALMLRIPDRFSKVILSSPMVDPSTGSFPRWVGCVLADGGCLIGNGKKMAFVSAPYDPEKDTFETSCDTGRERFEYYKAKRVKDRSYQTCGLSYRWISESMKVKKLLLSHPDAQKVTADVMLCQAGGDTVVRLPEQHMLIRRLPKGKLVRFDDAKHEIYISDDRTMKRYVEEVCAFLE